VGFALVSRVERRKRSALRSRTHSPIVEYLESRPLAFASVFASEGLVTGLFGPLEIGMQTHVSIPHHDYPAPVRDTVESKLSHLVKFYDRIVSMRALLEKQHDEHRVEIVANVGHGAVLVVDARGAAHANALEEALARMERLLKRHHDKMNPGRRRGR